jgi:hypothetical protein
MNLQKVKLIHGEVTKSNKLAIQILLMWRQVINMIHIKLKPPKQLRWSKQNSIQVRISVILKIWYLTKEVVINIVIASMYN